MCSQYQCEQGAIRVLGLLLGKVELKSKPPLWLMLGDDEYY